MEEAEDVEAVEEAEDVKVVEEMVEKPKAVAQVLLDLDLTPMLAARSWRLAV